MSIYEPYIKAETKTHSGKFEPRPEQQDAIDRAFKYFKKNEGKAPLFLWNAKMRFGKTVCALWLIERLFKEMGKTKILIVTHRPVVNASWYGDFRNLFHDSLDKYSYGTSKETGDDSSLKDFKSIRQDAASGKCVLFFASIQYLRRSTLVGGKEDSQTKKDILNYNWDLVIVDEAHEGTQTDLGESVINHLKENKPFMLYLSGTPFNLLDQFKAEQLYNWDYIKEQQYKRKWDEDNPLMKADNPYRELPRMEIMTFKLGEMTDEQAIKDAATGEFSFSEFFRVKTGHDVPKEERGKFLHEPQVIAFLKKLCQTSNSSYYPFSNDEFRSCFRHTLWVVPGVKEAQALKKLLERTPLCTKLGFKVVNVAGNSDDDELKADALDKVFKAMGVNPDPDNYTDDSDQTRTITLSCGRLTTGVTVRPWTAVLYMKGSETTSASTYMQTIFRVQSPHTINGMMKSVCYVFDFAPERALTMMAETAKYSRAFERKEKKGEKKQKAIIDKEDKEKMKELLNECPVFETNNGTPVIVNGRMKPIEVDRLFSQLNHVYVDKVVRNGFDDPSLYDNDKLLHLDIEDEFNLNYIDSMFGDDNTSSKDKGGNKVDVNHQHLTPAQLAAKEQEKKERDEAAKKAREAAKIKYAEKLAKMSPEAREKFLKDQEEHARKLKLLHQNKDKLHGLSIRIPLMMFGANIEDFESVTIDTFTNKRFIDDESWNEFMPNGVTRELFQKLSKFYNADVFRDAGVKIRLLAKEADNMRVEERIMRIAQIFRWFKNPDKETVLTSWEVVNRHLSSTLGGYCFFEDDFNTPVLKIDEDTGEELETKEPRFVDNGEITKEIFGDVTFGNIDELQGKINTKIMEINSKTGLYALYVAYTLYRQLLPIYAKQKGLLADDPNDYSPEDEQAIWDEVVSNNIYIICNTKMAERIVRRTLLGFRTQDNGKPIKLHIKQDKLVERARKDQAALIKDLRNEGYWLNNKTMNNKLMFNAVIGNPPYMETSDVNNRQNPIYHHFYELAELLSDVYTLITPARFLFNAGLTPSEWNQKMLNNEHLKVVFYTADSSKLFPNTNINGGVTITMGNARETYKPIGKFIPDDTLKVIASKFEGYRESGQNISSIMFGGRSDLKFNEAFLQAYPHTKEDRLAYIQLKRPAVTKLGQNEEYELKSSTFEALDYVFKENVEDTSNYYHLFGLIKSKRGWRYIEKKFMSPRYPDHNNIDKYKIFVSKADGAAGTIGKPIPAQICGHPQIGEPNDSSTSTFISIGAFDTLEEVENCAKYFKTKFFRCLLGILKKTQDNPPSVWSYIPLQNFTSDSDIDWQQEIGNIDIQLFEKYQLSEKERDYIQSMVKPMD
jgi:hypothetical protein